VRRSPQLRMGLLFSTTALHTPAFHHAGGSEYGKYDCAVCSSARLESIKKWLLDENSWPTLWAPLLAIRLAFDSA